MFKSIGTWLPPPEHGPPPADPADEPLPGRLPELEVEFDDEDVDDDVDELLSQKPTSSVMCQYPVYSHRKWTSKPSRKRVRPKRYLNVHKTNN